MIPWIGAMAGLVPVRCPNCGMGQMRSRKENPVICKGCRRSFTLEAGRASAQKAAARRRS
jgi:uncharacterized Zn finger protein (UPF0148 family)